MSKKTAGRPSAYKESYCQELLDYLAEGHSIAAFAGHVGVTKCTIFEWVKKHPDFAEAHQIAKGKSLAFWEDKLIAAAKGENKGAPAVLIFGVKNRGPEYWRDVQSLEHTGKDGKAIEVANHTTADRARALAAFIAKTKLKDKK